MAEYVKGRFHAARVGVTMAVLGLLAGLGIKNDATPPTTTVVADPAALTSLGKNSIGSLQIKNHSLVFSDIKLHQVPSYKEFKLFTTQFADKWIKLDTGNLVHKVDVYDKLTVDAAFAKVNTTFLKIDDANATFLHKGDTATNALKIDGLGTDQLVQGHGQVITGSTALGASDSDIFILIGLLRASAKNTVGAAGSVDVTLTNLASTDTLEVNGDGQPTSIKPGGTDTVTFADGSVRTLQIVVQGGNQAVTLGLSSFTGGVHTVVGQAVVGSF